MKSRGFWYEFHIPKSTADVALNAIARLSAAPLLISCEVTSIMANRPLGDYSLAEAARRDWNGGVNKQPARHKDTNGYNTK